MSAVATEGKLIRSTIPAQLDRLRWSPFHTRMVAGLGAAWILGINAEGKSLESITKPLTASEAAPEPAAAVTV